MITFFSSGYHVASEGPGARSGLAHPLHFYLCGIQDQPGDQVGCIP